MLKCPPLLPCMLPRAALCTRVRPAVRRPGHIGQEGLAGKLLKAQGAPRGRAAGGGAHRRTARTPGRPPACWTARRRRRRPPRAPPCAPQALGSGLGLGSLSVLTFFTPEESEYHEGGISAGPAAGREASSGQHRQSKNASGGKQARPWKPAARPPLRTAAPSASSPS